VKKMQRLQNGWWSKPKKKKEVMEWMFFSGTGSPALSWIKGH